MVNPIKRFKEWRNYKRALKAMRLLAEREKEIHPDKDGLIKGDDKKLFDLYAAAFMVNATVVMEYQTKYFKRL